MIGYPLIIGVPPEPLDQRVSPIVEPLRDVPHDQPWALQDPPPADAAVTRTLPAGRTDLVPTCRVCGCSEFNACFPSCWWVTYPAGLNPLCSACGQQ